MSGMPKGIGLGPELHAYLVAHGTPPDPVLADLAEAETLMQLLSSREATT